MGLIKDGLYGLSSQVDVSGRLKTDRPIPASRKTSEGDISLQQATVPEALEGWCLSLVEGHLDFYCILFDSRQKRIRGGGGQRPY